MSGISFFLVDQAPKTTAGSELTFVVWRLLPFGAASVSYQISGGTAVAGTDYDTSIDAYSGVLSFADEEVWKKVTLQTLTGGSSLPVTVNCEITNPVGGSIQTPSSTGRINAGTVAYYAASAAGAGDGSSPGNEAAFDAATVDAFFGNTKVAGKCASIKRGDSVSLDSSIRLVRGQGGTVDAPMIFCAHGTGAAPVLLVDASRTVGVTRANGVTDEDHSFVVRDLNFQPTSNNGVQVGDPVSATNHPSPQVDDEPYLNFIVERVTFTNPNSYAGYSDAIFLGPYAAEHCRLRFCEVDSCCGDEYIPYDGQTSNFTNGLTVTDGTSGATAVIVQDINSGTSGFLRVTSVTGVWTDNAAITDTGGGAAVVDIPAPNPTPSQGQNPSQIMLTGGSGILTGEVDYLHVYGNKLTNLGPTATNRSWATYIEGTNLRHYGNWATCRQGFKFRSMVTGEISFNYSRTDNGAQNYNINYFDGHLDFSNVMIYSNIAAGASGYTFQEADGTDAIDMTWGFKHIMFFNNIAYIDTANVGWTLLNTCFGMSTLNMRDVSVDNNLFYHRSDLATEAAVLGHSNGTLKEDKYNFRNNLVKRVTSGTPSRAMIRTNGGTEITFAGDYNVFDFTEGSFNSLGGTFYDTLADHQAQFSNELNSVSGSVTLTSVIGGVDIGMNIVPDVGGLADAAGLSGITTEDFRQKLRAQPPTAGAIELNDGFVRGTYFGAF